MNKFMTVKFPLAPILMELAAQLQDRQMELRLDWIPRDLNQQADRLSNFDTSDFDPECEIPVDLKSVKFILLDDMLERGAEMYKQIADLKAQNATKKPWKGVAGVRDRLKDRSPW